MVGSLLLLALGAPARALDLTVSIDRAAAAQAGVDPDAAQAEIEAASEGAFDVTEPRAFLARLAAANAVATSGMGVDYASNAQRFHAGASLGSATSGGAFQLSQPLSPPEGPGFALHAAGEVGVNLGLLAEPTSPLRRFVVSVHGAVTRDERDTVVTEMENVGGHLQVKAVLPRELGAVTWGGLDLTTGYRAATYRVLLANTSPVTTDGLRWDGEGTLALVAQSGVVPIEVSTNARHGFLTAYVGAALDLRPRATADADLALTGPLVARARGADVPIGTVSARLEIDGQAADAAPRAFGGVQLNLGFVRVYGHMTIANESTFGAHVGARVAL